MDFRGHCDSEAETLARFTTPVKAGVVPRWQRKALEAQAAQAAAASSDCGSVSGSSSDEDDTLNAPRSSKKTPRADRFVPSRLDMDVAHFNLTANDLESAPTSADGENGSSNEYRQDVANHLFDGANGSKILSFKTKAPEPRDGYQNNLRVLYSQNRATGSSKAAPAAAAVKPTRHIPSAPIRVLDAPDLVDDYYLNLLDWSEENMLAIGLGRNVYMWNATSGDTTLLTEVAEGDSITSVSWARDGAVLAIGTNSAEIQLWDVERQKRLRTIRGHGAARIPSLSWNGNIVSSGAKDGVINHNDVRLQNPVIAQLKGHSQEVCGLKWSPDGSQLASGGNDNILNIWGGVSSQLEQVPIFSLNHHQAAVKALAWCPWQQNLLASGGGTADRHLRMWNTANGSCVQAVDTQSQVCSIVWSKEYRELVTSHGVSRNQLTLWRYPTLSKVAELTGHSARVLHMAISPDGERVASAAADETLRLWHCFARDASNEASNNATAANKSIVGSKASSARPRDLASAVSLR